MDHFCPDQVGQINRILQDISNIYNKQSIHIVNDLNKFVKLIPNPSNELPIIKMEIRQPHSAVKIYRTAQEGITQMIFNNYLNEGNHKIKNNAELLNSNIFYYSIFINNRQLLNNLF